jgi:predicted permease
MISFFRRIQWWLQRRRKEDELRQELEFHLTEETERQQAEGVTEHDARRAARRDLGNTTLLREDVRPLWSWALLEQFAQDVRYGVRGMVKNRMFTALAALSLGLGIGANTAIYSFMDAILWRSLPVADPASLVRLKWQSGPVNFGAMEPFVMRGTDGTIQREAPGITAAIFPFPAFERLHDEAAPVLSSLFAHKRAGRWSVIVNGEAEFAQGEYVSGDFFPGLAVRPAAGRLIAPDDDRAGATPIAVLSLAYSQRRFGDAVRAVGQTLLINNVPFTVAGVAPPEFFGVDPAIVPHVYLPMRASRLLLEEVGPQALVGPNFYWVELMGRLKPGVDRPQAQATLTAPFARWVASTAGNDQERANLPALRLEEGAGGLDSLRRQYSKPLYVLLAMVGLILALACANTANLLLARAAARTHEMAVRLSLGAGRWRVVRQMLTESVLLAALSGGLGILIAVVSMGALTRLMSNGQPDFTLHAELNWNVLLVTVTLSFLCGVLFGLAPALHATRPTLSPALGDRSIGEGARLRTVVPRVGLTRVLVVGQIAISLLLLVAAGLFVRTLSNLQSISLGFNRENVLQFEVHAPRAGLPASRVADFYLDLRSRLNEIPGVREVTVSHASLIRAGRSHPVTVGGQRTEGTRVMLTGPRFFTTMQVPIVRGREIVESDRQATPLVAVVSELFARTNFGEEDPVGRSIEIEWGAPSGGRPVSLTIVGVATNARYGPLKFDVPPVVYVAYAQVPTQQMGWVTYALRTQGDPLHYAGAVRQVVQQADGRVPISNLKTQAADIDQTINQEIVFARLCSAFAMLALMIACVGLYATMAYAVVRRTREIGLRVALGAQPRVVTWMVLREVCVLAAVGLAIAVPAALATSRFIESFLFRMQPNDPQTLAAAAGVLLAAALAAGYGPARRASRVDPMIALRHE